MELDHLDTFLAVYRSGNVTAAAGTLHLSQPAVSAHLKALEAEVGSPLFVRLARGVTPTALAHQLADSVAGPLDALHVAARQFNPAASSTSATCFIGGPADALGELVLPALSGLIGAGLQIRVRTGLTGPLMSELSDGELDMVVATTPARRRNVVTTPLFNERLMLVAGSASGVRRRPNSDAGRLLDELVGLPLVAYDTSAPLVRRYWRDQFATSQVPQPMVVVPDLRAIVTLLASGVGYSVVPHYLAEPAIKTGQLRLLHQPDMPSTNTLYLATRASRRHLPAIEAVHDALAEAFGAVERADQGPRQSRGGNEKRLR